MKTILLFGAGKSSTVLIDYLIAECKANQWKFIIADANKEQILLKTNNDPFVEAIGLDISDDATRGRLIERSHVVISMMPPALHFSIAKDCVEYRKHLLTASYMDPQIKSLADEVRHRKLLFLCEMGLDPGIDHMSAMKLIDDLKNNKKNIVSFKSHCGGLIAPESDDNPWHYKISWNPRNVVLAGKAGAEFLQDGVKVQVPYNDIFKNCQTIQVEGLSPLAYYPNRDSLSYIPIYQLQSAHTFIRTTLRYANYCNAWRKIVDAGLTSDADSHIADGLTFKKWSEPLATLTDAATMPLFEHLGMFENLMVPSTAKTSADILQYLLETKLAMKPHDKDMIVMLHEIAYDGGIVNSSLVVKGEDALRTAMAKTVGLPLGVAAKLILNETIKLRGLHIPIKKEIYEPVLEELKHQGIQFNETFQSS